VQPIVVVSLSSHLAPLGWYVSGDALAYSTSSLMVNFSCSILSDAGKRRVSGLGAAKGGLIMAEGSPVAIKR